MSASGFDADHARYWVGINSKQNQSRWSYESNGEVPLFGFPWHPSQPSNGNDERCIIVDNRDWSNSQGGKWFDSPCGGEVWFWSICQREGSVQRIS